MQYIFSIKKLICKWIFFLTEGYHLSLQAISFLSIAITAWAGYEAKIMDDGYGYKPVYPTSKPITSSSYKPIIIKPVITSSSYEPIITEPAITSKPIITSNPYYSYGSGYGYGSAYGYGSDTDTATASPTSVVITQTSPTMETMEVTAPTTHYINMEAITCMIRIITEVTSRGSNTGICMITSIGKAICISSD